MEASMHPQIRPRLVIFYLLIFFIAESLVYSQGKVPVYTAEQAGHHIGEYAVVRGTK
jgi:hypothetical protein